MNAPIEIKRVKDTSGKGIGLEVVWTSDERITFSTKVLRDNCPCATCEEARGKQSHANPLGAPKSGRSLLQVVKSTADEGYELKKIWAIGNYAVGLEWGDGHNSGIYSYGILQMLRGS